jgi:hypothetical protein
MIDNHVFKGDFRMSFYLKVEVEVGIRNVLIGHDLSLFSHVMTPPVHAPYCLT